MTGPTESRHRRHKLTIVFDDVKSYAKMVRNDTSQADDL
jgi:hypothetical protein